MPAWTRQLVYERYKIMLMEMSDLPLVGMTRLIEGVASSDTFQDLLSVAEIKGDLFHPDEGEAEHLEPMRLDALVLVLVERGTAEILVDYVPYEVGRGSFLTLMPTHVVQATRISRDFMSRMLCVSKTFFDGYSAPPERKNSSMIRYMQIRKNPCATLEEAEMAVAREQFDRLRDKTRERGHYFLREALQNALVGLFIELANIFRHKMGELPTLTLTRKEELFEQFLRLLFEHCKEQHVVTFYAERLCITPQYLSLILKEQSGKSANKWIDDALIMEAKVLLKAPNATVQQVADALHFSDQSTFGKFFKKHMGISPMEYRKS